MLVPKYMFLTKGVGRHREKLNSFELALRKAGIAHCNLTTVSSIVPPGCKFLSREAGLKLIQPGQIVFCVLSRAETNEPNRLIAASIGVARPKDRKMFGYLSEHHSYGQTQIAAGDYAEDIAAEMLATTLGLDFNPDTSWDEKRELWRISGKIVRTRSVTQSARGDKKGLWTTVVTAAIFVV